MHSSKDRNFVNPQDYSLPPDKRPAEWPASKSAYATQQANSHGCIPRFYEPLSPWVQYECLCGQMFWMKGPPSQVRSCRQQGYVCAPRAGSTQLALIGKVYGSLTVVGHERGKGWKVKCACGNERYLMNSTQLAQGGYKSCGRCAEYVAGKLMTHREVVMAEATLGSALATMDAPSSSLRESDVAANSFLGGPMRSCCMEHAAIMFNGVDCPLCLALARIEILES
jgi:hypothetical protein